MKGIIRTKLRKILSVSGSLILVAFVASQFFRPEIEVPQTKTGFNGSPEVKAILKRACYDCHSNETDLRWYDKIQPVYSLVAGHIRDGRQGLNFSDWKKMSNWDQKGKLWESINQIAAGAMPIKSYEVVHPASAISANDLAVLKKYVSDISTHKISDSTQINDADKQYKQWTGKNTEKANLPKAANGITYIPDYKNWQAISSTERFDNGTMRVILGNDVAIKAIAQKQTKPWPNGTIFAKVAWDQLEDKEGNVHTGAFKQIEYMVKDDIKYASTKGWGWARFKTLKLVPYGKNLLFTTECINCHRPQADNDFVFTLPIKH